MTKPSRSPGLGDAWPDPVHSLTQREGCCGRKEKRWESRREAGRKPSAGEESTEGTAALHRNTPPCSHTNHYFSVYRRGESLAEKSTREGNSQFRYVARHASPFQCLLSASLPSLRPAADLATGAEGKGGAATCPASSVTTFDTQDRTGGRGEPPEPHPLAWDSWLLSLCEEPPGE